MGKRTSVYLTDDLAEAIKAAGVSLSALLWSGLEFEHERRMTARRRLQPPCTADLAGEALTIANGSLAAGSDSEADSVSAAARRLSALGASKGGYARASSLSRQAVIARRYTFR